MTGLATLGTRDDVGRIALHLESNAPGVAKAALAALDAIDREAAASAVVAALRDDTMHRETRRAFEAYLRQRVGWIGEQQQPASITKRGVL